MNAGDIQIRPCETQDEYERCVELQRTAWGFNDYDLVSKEIFIVAAETGGQVIGAYQADSLIGFAMSFAGYRDGRPYLHSHMLAVLSEYRDRGIGRRLKLKQREDALDRGINLIEWTFDPMEVKNAYFNLMRLGIIVRRYIRDLYGQTSSPLHAGMPTDRLVAEWWLRSSRTEGIIAGQPVPVPAQPERIAIPRAIEQLRHVDTAAAAKVNAQTRQAFERWLGQGYAVTGFEVNEEEGIYLLERYED